MSGDEPLKEGTLVSATVTWGYGSRTVVGTLGRDWLGGFDSNSSLLIWTLHEKSHEPFEGVIVDTRHWSIKEKVLPSWAVGKDA
ncbi:hypothetical protein SEA_CECE_279 [Microbacterium phage Cece]|nr:hypothetical protein SEA_CECE_279 [Microbacterium phage Cece]